MVQPEEDTVGTENRAIQAPLSPYVCLDDDGHLCAALLDGEVRALELVDTRHGRRLYSLAVHLLGDRSAAEDVVQETFLELWRHPAAYQPSRGRLVAWLLSVAHHRAVDVLRRRELEQRRRVAPPSANCLVDLLDSFGPASPEATPQSGIGNLESRGLLERALSSLPNEQRLPLELAYFGGMTLLEISTALGIPPGTIKYRTRLALQGLRLEPSLSAPWNER